MNKVRMIIWWVSGERSNTWCENCYCLIFAVQLKRAKVIGGGWTVFWWVSAVQKHKEAVDCTAVSGGSLAVAQFLSHLPKTPHISLQARPARGCSALPCPPLHLQTDRGGRSRQLVGLQANIRHWHPPDCCTSKR